MRRHPLETTVDDYNRPQFLRSKNTQINIRNLAVDKLEPVLKMNQANLFSNWKLILFFVIVAASSVGCGMVAGKYGEEFGFTVEILEVREDGRIYVSDFKEGRSTVGRIKTITTSSDGSVFDLSGVMLYSGGTGSAFGMTVTKAKIFESPFTIRVNKSEGILSFSGMLENKYRYDKDGLKRFR
jgi:hypothetical protein